MINEARADYLADLSNGIPKSLFWIINNIVSPAVPYVILFSIDDCHHFLTHFVDKVRS